MSQRLDLRGADKLPDPGRLPRLIMEVESVVAKRGGCVLDAGALGLRVPSIPQGRIILPQGKPGAADERHGNTCPGEPAPLVAKDRKQ